jgi:hypothetical protein
MRLRPVTAFVSVACTLLVSACGGGGSSPTAGTPGTGGAGGLGLLPVFQQPDGTVSHELPSSIKTIRIVFQSGSLQCCLAVDPKTVPINPVSNQRVLVLDNLPAGSGTLMLAGFATDFAPAPEGITDVCPTTPPGVGQACDPSRPATPSFQSDDTPVTVVPGSRAGGSAVQVDAFPFLLGLSPGPDSSTASSFPIKFTAVDAISGISQDSIQVFFRSISKRNILAFQPCDDETATPCSQDGSLKVKGFQVTSIPLSVPAGPGEVRITASNLANPPRSLDFSYEIMVLSSTSAAGAGSGGSDAGASATATDATPTPAAETVANTEAAAALLSQTAPLDLELRSTSAPLATATPTPTATPTSQESDA